MGKIRLLFFILFAFWFGWCFHGQPVQAVAYKPVHIEVDASVLSYDPAFTYQIVNDRLLVQTSALAKAIGASEQLDPARESVTISKAARKIVLKANSPYALVNEKKVPLEVAPRQEHGELLVPLRFVSQTLGVKVEWNAAYRAAILSTHKKHPGIVDKQMLMLAGKGTVKGVAFPLGTPQQQIERAWGQPFDSYYYEGGKFFAYKGCNCSVLYDEQGKAAIYELFSPKVGYLYTEDVRKVLGKPEWEDESATHSNYLLYYPVGSYAITFFATFREGTIMSLWLEKRE